MKGFGSSIIRQYLPTKDWTIFSVKRAERPYDFLEQEEKRVLKEYEPDCPFVWASRSILEINGGGKDWAVKSVKNKFPAVQTMEDFDE